MRQFIYSLFPARSMRRKLVKKILRKSHLYHPILGGYYNTWAHQLYNTLPLRSGEKIHDEPLISIVVPAYNTTPTYFYELIYSIVSQAYTNWELIIVNASNNKKLKDLISNSSQIDTRIRVIPFPNQGIAKNTNRGIKAAKGDYVAFVDHDDILDTFALYEVAKVIEDQEVDLIYSDEDKISADGNFYYDPHFKPDWSPDLLTHVNYINHLTVVKMSILKKVNALDPTKDGAQDYDLILKLTDESNRIYHIPKVLYHWRAAENSTATNFSSKRNITNVGTRALQEHFRRKKVNIKVKAKEDSPGFYNIQAIPAKEISLIITPFTTDALLRLYVELILKKTNRNKTNLEVIIPIGAEPHQNFKNCKIISLPTGSEFLSAAINKAQNENTIIINQILFPYQKDWLERFSGLLCLDHIAAVAPIVLKGGVMIEDCGLVKSANGALSPLFVNQVYPNNQTYLGNTGWVRNVNALSGDFVFVRKRELADFIKEYGLGTSSQQLLKEYTLNQADKGKYNVVFSDVPFDNYSIRIKSPNQGSTFFNDNLIMVGTALEIYTSETVAINILFELQEQESSKDVTK